jgi:hypothetical protein
MKFRIHYETKDFQDWFIIDGESIEEIQGKVKQEMEKRGLDEKKNNLWSEEIK